MEDLEEFVERHYIKNSGLRLLNSEDAIKFVELCRARSIKLGGFDGFYIHPEGVQIESSLSRDYSHNSKEEAENLALKFLSEHRDGGTNIGYEMVIVKVA